jgi:hypothetical protein
MAAPKSERGTSNLFRHLKQVHSTEHSTALQASARSSNVRQQKAAANSIQSGKQQTIAELLCMSQEKRDKHNRRWVIASAVDMLPCSAIANDGMLLFVGGFSPPYTGQVRLLIQLAGHLHHVALRAAARVHDFCCNMFS